MYFIRSALKIIKLFKVFLLRSWSVIVQSNDEAIEPTSGKDCSCIPYFSKDRDHPPDFHRYLRTLKRVVDISEELSELLGPMVPPPVVANPPSEFVPHIDFRMHSILLHLRSYLEWPIKDVAVIGIQHLEWKLQNREINWDWGPLVLLDERLN